jgi:hypothetical protein
LGTATTHFRASAWEGVQAVVNPLGASNPEIFKVGTIKSQAAQMAAQIADERNGSLASNREEAAEGLQEEIAVRVVNQMAEQYRGIQKALTAAAVTRYDGLMEEQSTIDMEIQNSYAYKNSVHDTVMMDENGNIYVSEDDIDGNYIHYRINEDGTRTATPEVNDWLAEGRMTGIYTRMNEQGKSEYLTLDGKALDNETVQKADDLLRRSGSSLQTETRSFRSAKASVDCHDAREEVVNADGRLETLQEHITITEDNASDIFLQTQQARFDLAEKKMDYAAKMAIHSGDHEKAVAAMSDYQKFQEQKEKFTQFRIEADALKPAQKDELLQKVYGDEWTQYKARALQPLPAPDVKQSAPASPRGQQSPSYGERSASHVQDENGIQSNMEVSMNFNREALGNEIRIVPPAPAPQQPAPVARMLSGPNSNCA